MSGEGTKEKADPLQALKHPEGVLHEFPLRSGVMRVLHCNIRQRPMIKP